MKPLATIVLIVLATTALVTCGGDEPDAPATTPTAVASTAASGPTAVAAADCPTEVNVLNRDVGGSGAYAFEPNEITVCEGDTVKFTITAQTEFHTFTVDALAIDVELSAGETAEISIPFVRRGEFELICVPHQSVGMKGTITVK